MKRLLHRSWRWWVVVGVIAAVAISGVVYGAYSFLSWQSYGQRTQAWQKSTKQMLVRTLSLPGSTEAERLQKTKTLKDTTRSLRGALSTACTPARLTGWQLAFSGPKTERQRCGTYAEKIEKVASQLEVTTVYLEDESKTVGILLPAISLPQAVSETDWDHTAHAWSTMHASLSSLTVSAAFIPTKEHITTVTAGIDVAWKEVIAAHAKKDKASFVAATATLQKSYEGVGGLADISATQLDALSRRLGSLVDTL